MDFNMLMGMWPVLAVLAAAALILWRLEVRERQKIRQREDIRRVLEAQRQRYPTPPPPTPSWGTLHTPRTGRMSSGRSNLSERNEAPVNSLRKRDTAPVDSARTPDPYPTPVFADDWLVTPVSVAPSECTPEPDNKFTGYSGGDSGGGGASDSWSGGDSSGPTDAGGGGCASDSGGGGCGSE